MSAKHTPGPWNVHQGVDYIQIETPDGTHAITGAKLYPDANDEANYRLIAAAPELLAVAYCIEDLGDELEAALIGDTLEEFQRVRAMHRAAIAKAEGAL